MTRPDTLTTTTVGETREKYRKNQKTLDNVLLLTTAGAFTDLNNESIINTFMTSLVVEQEYIRERERKNWGWDPKLVDFSTCEDRIPQFRA